MFTNSNGYSLADIAAATNSQDDTWGSGMSWWIIILFLFMFMGWGGTGWGGTAAGASDNYVLASDFSTLSRQIDSQTSDLMRQTNQIANGLCDGFYTQAQLVNGVNQNISTQGYDTRNAITQSQINAMQNANAIQSQLASGFCGTNSSISDVNYNMASQANAIQSAMSNGFCTTNYNNSNNTRDIVDAQTANTQAILAKLNQMESNAQADKIADLTAENQRLAFAASQQAQNAYLVNQLAPIPRPAYLTSSPYATYSYGCSCSST